MLEISLRTQSSEMPSQSQQDEATRQWLMDTMQNRRLLVQQRDQANQKHGKGAYYIAERPLGATEQTH